MTFENSFTESSKALYDKLVAAGVEINFEIDEKADCWSVQEQFKYKIASHTPEPNQAAMAHELLHIQLHLKGFYNVLSIYKYFNEQTSIFTPDFLSRLNNNVAHFKMLDAFLEMGFNIDDFLQDTPKTYFLEGMLVKSTLMVAQHKAGMANLCEQTREIILLVAGAKLFELYKVKDPNTKNGLHPDLVMNPLREINKELVDELNVLFNEWNEANTVDNQQFYARLNIALKKLGIPNAVDCK